MLRRKTICLYPAMDEFKQKDMCYSQWKLYHIIGPVTCPRVIEAVLPSPLCPLCRTSRLVACFEIKRHRLIKYDRRY